MSTSIRISEETKKKLEARKREDESFDELLERLARTEKDVEQMGGWLDKDEADELKEHVKEKREELHDSMKKRQDELHDSMKKE
jgi:predicted CopG family antitoxin